MSVCRSCGAPIVWAVSAKSGKRMPLDARPVLNGNLDLDADGTVTVVEPDPTLKGYVSHHATCPDADDWRKKK
jgi:hypothetical protein